MISYDELLDQVSELESELALWKDLAEGYLLRLEEAERLLKENNIEFKETV